MSKRKVKSKVRSAKKKPAMKRRSSKGTRVAKKKAAGAATEIMAWEDDPMSKRAPAKRPIPDPAKTLKYRINGPAVVPGIYDTGTKEFRYWTAAEALRRCSD